MFEKDYGETLSTTLNDFEEALLHRWREQVCEEARRGTHDYPVVIRRSTSPHSHQPLWEYWSRPAREHLRFPGQCAFLAWVDNGQPGTPPLSAVTCDGATGTTEDVEVWDGRDMVVVPPYIECGMGSVLAQVEHWARGERDHLFYRIPLFDYHDIDVLEGAYDALIKLGRNLALEAHESSHINSEEFNASSPDDLRVIVKGLYGENNTERDWMTGWTGVAAKSAGSNFFHSTSPTINNQSQLLGCLVNLYSDRAAMIMATRNNTIRLLQVATEALGETGTRERAEDWKVVSKIGTGISLTLGWTGKGAAVGTAVSLVGFLGENFDNGTREVGYTHEIAELVHQLNNDIDDVNSDLEGYELEYNQAAGTLRRSIFEVHSYNLELYDLTQNNPDGNWEETGESADSFSADIDALVGIAEECYKAGVRYEDLLPRLRDTDQADRHLADKDGNQTEGDKIVLELRDQLGGFLRTTAGRYLLAGDQVIASAEDYVEVDTSQQAKFERSMGDLEGTTSRFDSALNPQEYAQETDRSGYDPYEGHPARGGSEPGAGSIVAPGSGHDAEYHIEG